MIVQTARGRSGCIWKDRQANAKSFETREAAMLGLPYQSIFAEEVRVGDRTIAGNQLKWSVFHDFPAAKMYSVVQDIDKRGMNHYNVLVSDTSTKGNESYDILCKRYDP